MKSTSSHTNLKQELNDKLSENSLSVKQLNALHGIIKGKQPPQKYSRQIWTGFAGIAIAVLVVFISALPSNQSIEMPQLIANEVVRNHLKLKPLEISTNSLDDIRSHFTKLKFSPISSLNIPSSGQLLGGRYCSIQGYKAAQLRIKNPESNKIDTLYQAPYVKDTFGSLPDIGKNENPIVVYERGIKVSIWVEKGILFARTHIDDNQ